MITPFGNPNTMNAAIAVNAIANPLARPTGNQRVNAPYTMLLPTVPAQPMPRPVRKVFRSKKYCIICGWTKIQHIVEFEGKGGRDRRGNIHCKRQYCGRCGDMVQYHIGHGMGPECTRPIRNNGLCDANVADWYEYKVSGASSFLLLLVISLLFHLLPLDTISQTHCFFQTELRCWHLH
jgi:hypothetical protein